MVLYGTTTNVLWGRASRCRSETIGLSLQFTIFQTTSTDTMVIPSHPQQRKRIVPTPVYELENASKVVPSQPKRPKVSDEDKQTPARSSSGDSTAAPSARDSVDLSTAMRNDPTTTPEEFDAAIKTAESGDQYVKLVTLAKMPWSKKKKIANRQWSIRVNLAVHDNELSLQENAEKYETSLSYLLNKFHQWDTPAFIYVGPVFQRNHSEFYQVDVALQCESLCTYSSICKHLGSWREDKPVEYHVWPTPGSPFKGLLGPYGLLDPGRTLIKTGPLFVRGEPKALATIWVKSVLQLEL